ncbi:beta-phosphoglucomutase [Thiofilum flexile]|uniref:beta-phosphoglucomutase n=1 Tax=Thiofilum flexile TaxID=125627 RepID=UPI00036AC8CA|nr:beta-phosphoglucomutase [Thiofilum flexile]
MNKPTAFIFDLDGVITDTAHYHFLAWQALAQSIGIDFDAAFNENLKGVGRMESLELILQKGNKANAYTLVEKEAMATQKNEHYKELIVKMTPDEVLPKIPELLQRLQQSQVKIGLASASKNAFTVLGCLKMLGDFDYVADAAKIPNSKPAPDVFLDVAKHFGLDSKYCIGVEDAAAGVESIHRAGMFAVGIGDVSSLGEADILFPNTAAIDVDAIYRAYDQWFKQQA